MQTFAIARVRALLASIPLACLLPSALSAQTGASVNPFSLDEIVGFIGDGVRSTRVLEEVRPACISFAMDSGNEARLRQAGADATLLEGLRATCGAAGPSLKGRLVISTPQQWTGTASRGIGVAPGAGKRVRVEGTALHPSGVKSVSINGQAAVTAPVAGGARFIGYVAPEATSRRTEIVAYPVDGAPIVTTREPLNPPQLGAGGPAGKGGNEAVLGRAVLTVSIAGLPSETRRALTQAIGDLPGMVLTDIPGADREVRAVGGSYVVLGSEGTPRSRVDAATPTAGAEALIPVLRREMGAHYLATLENPARPFWVGLSFQDNKTSFRLGEPIQLTVQAGKAGYLTVVDVDAAGKVSVLFPNHLDGQNFIRAGQQITFPTESMPPLEALEPAGWGTLRVFVTDQPINLPPQDDFSPVDPDVVIQGLERALAEAQARGLLTSRSWATGTIAYEIRK